MRMAVVRVFGLPRRAIASQPLARRAPFCTKRKVAAATIAQTCLRIRQRTE